MATELVARLQQVRTLVGERTGGQDTVLSGRFHAAMKNDLNTPEALLLLHRAAETMLANHNINTGAEILRLARILGLRIEG